MDVVSFAWSRTVSLGVGALKHTMIRRVPFPNCRSGVTGLAIAGNPENDGHLSPWQEAVGHVDHPGRTQERLRERGNDWPHARALRDAVTGRRVQLTGTRESVLQPISAKRW
jgi:hypothetical protein